MTLTFSPLLLLQDSKHGRISLQRRILKLNRLMSRPSLLTHTSLTLESYLSQARLTLCSRQCCTEIVLANRGQTVLQGSRL